MKHDEARKSTEMQHRGPVGPPPFYGKEAGILLKGTKIEQAQTRKNAKFTGIQNQCVGVVACVFLEFWVRVLELDMLCIVLYETTSQFKWLQDEINGIICLDSFGYFQYHVCRCRWLLVLGSCFCRMLAGVVGPPKVLHLGKQASPEKMAARLHANDSPSTYRTRNKELYGSVPSLDNSW